MTRPKDPSRDDVERARARARAALAGLGVLRPGDPAATSEALEDLSAAARNLLDERVVVRARVVWCDPSPALRSLRHALLDRGLTLLIPSARIDRDGVHRVLDGARMPARDRAGAASNPAYGAEVGDAAPPIDLFVATALQVDVDGARLGFGDGGLDLAYALLRQRGSASVRTPVVVLARAAQVVRGGLPRRPHDVPADLIVTETQVLRTHTALPRPAGLHRDIAPPALRSSATMGGRSDEHAGGFRPPDGPRDAP